MYEHIANHIRKKAKEELGMTKGSRNHTKETRSWNIEVQKAISEKKRCFKEWQMKKSLETYQLYKQAKKHSTRAVGEAKKRACDDLYARLGTKEGEKDIYKIAKVRERKTRDLSNIRCIKNEDGRILTQDEEILNRWMEYFSKLLNETNTSKTNLRKNNSRVERHFHRRIRTEEVNEALKKMKSGKAVGPDDLPIEVWRCMGEVGVQWLTRLFNRIFETKKMPDAWRHSVVVPIYKNKGDIQNCTNYRGIKLMSHTMKLCERIIERRLRSITSITKNQFGFMPGRSTIEAIFILRQLIEKYREKRKKKI